MNSLEKTQKTRNSFEKPLTTLFAGCNWQTKKLNINYICFLNKCFGPKRSTDFATLALHLLELIQIKAENKYYLN